MSTSANNLSQALDSLASIQKNPPITKNEAGLVHQWSPREAQAIQVALVTRRPLLIRGEPGCGKTQLAAAVAHELGWALHARTVHPRIEAQDLVYQFDAVKRLAYAHRHQTTNDDLDSPRYYEPGPLWWALDWCSAAKAGRRPLCASEQGKDKTQPVGHVVLIDEIDKADSDLPNALLELFGERQLTVPCQQAPLKFPSQGMNPPLILITTNEDRELPAPFLRRCVVLSMDVQADDVSWLVSKRGRAHFSAKSETNIKYLSGEVLKLAAELMVQERIAFRQAGLVPPGVAEYIDLLEALHALQKAHSWDESHLKKEISALARYLYRKHGGPDLPVDLQQTAGLDATTHSGLKT